MQAGAQANNPLPSILLVIFCILKLLHLILSSHINSLFLVFPVSSGISTDYLTRAFQPSYLSTYNFHSLEASPRGNIATLKVILEG